MGEDTAAAESSLNTVTNKHRAIPLPSDGRKVEIRCCRTRDISAVITLVGKVIAATGMSMDISQVDEKMLAHFKNPETILKLISELIDDIVVVGSLLSSLSAEEIDELELDDLVAFVTEVVKENYDFFTKRVAPVLNRALPEEVAIGLKVASKTP